MRSPARRASPAGRSRRGAAYRRRRVTEIPEHLLKRSRDRRAALGLGGGERGRRRRGCPGRRRRPPPAPRPRRGGRRRAGRPGRPQGGGRGPPRHRRRSPIRRTSRPPSRRQKIPFWAMAALSLMPIWLFMYVRSLTEPPEVAAGPARRRRRGLRHLRQSATARSGEGGVGRPFAEGEVLKTFPHIEDQLRFVYFGTAEYNIAGVDELRQPRPRGRPARDRVARRRCPARARPPAATSPTTRSSPSSATSATRSAAPTRRATSTSRSSRTGARRSRRSSPPSRPASPLDRARRRRRRRTPRASAIEIIAIGDAPVAGSPPGE